MPINEAEFQVRGVRDPQLAVHATSALPAWLWTHDGTRMLWANPVGAAVFGARNSTALAARTFGPADPHRRQVARLAGQLPLDGTPRLERLRGFGTALGLLVTCACTRLVFSGGGIGILVAALTPVGRAIAYDERAQRLVDDLDAPVAAFTRDGGLIAANAAAAPLFAPKPAGTATDLAAPTLDRARHDALRDGRADAKLSIGRIQLQRVGHGTDTTLLAFVTPAIAQTSAAAAPAADPAAEPLPAAIDLAVFELQSLDDIELSSTAAPQRDSGHAPDEVALSAHIAEAAEIAPTIPAVFDPPADVAASTPTAIAEHATEGPAFDEQLPHREHAWQPDAPVAHHEQHPVVDAATPSDVAPARQVADDNGLVDVGEPATIADAEQADETLACEAQPAHREIAQQPEAAAHHGNHAVDGMAMSDVAPILKMLAARLAEFTAATIGAPLKHGTEAATSEPVAFTAPVPAVAIEPSDQPPPVAVDDPVDTANPPREPETASPFASPDHADDGAASTPHSLLDEFSPTARPILKMLANRLAEFTSTVGTPLTRSAEATSSEPVAFTEPASALAIDPAKQLPPVAVDDPVDMPADPSHEPEAAHPIAAPDHARDDTSASLSLLDEFSSTERRHPLRFMWQMDKEGRFSLGSDEFSRLIGPRTATAFGRLWSEIAAVFGLDPDGRVQAAIATRDTWSGITVNWPADGTGGRLPVELSGLPIYDRTHFLGYRGFGVCRDLEALATLAAQRRHDALHPAPPLQETQAMTQDVPVQDIHVDNIRDQDIHPKAATDPEATMDSTAPATSPDPVQTALDALPSSPSTETDHPVDSPQNVVPFRPATDLKTPTLTPVENNAFNELARQLASRLETERLELDARDRGSVISPELFANATDEGDPLTSEEAASAPAAPDREWSAPTHAHTPPHADSRRDMLLYDRMPVGILVYRLDRLLYANKTFLDRVGYTDLQALAAAGGLDALYVEPGADGGGSTSDEGTPVKIAATGRDDTPTEARLHSMSWDGDAAHALIFSAPRTEPAVQAPAAPPPVVAPAASAEIDTRADELGTILDATDDGILIFDADGRVLTCNRGAEILFGYDDRDIVQCNLTELFAPDSHGAVHDDVATLKTGQRPQRREVKGRARSGDALALSLTIGRTTANSERFFAICRNLATAPAGEAPKVAPPTSESDASAKRQADRAANARADILARISHEVRTPLNSIIGFADVMIEERFGALGNERYVAYMKDIRAAGERVLAIISDLLDLSRAETGKLDLTFARQDLNEMVEKCVTIMQPQANRERIIIRTSLAHALPPVTADADALRQIVLNLVGNSIHVARAGGQVIVSTALTDLGDVVLRVRDTGRGLNHSEMEAALEQFRNPSAELSQDNVGINLSLTRALVEANQAQFHIKSAPQSGTLVEIAFTPKAAQAV